MRVLAALILWQSLSAPLPAQPGAAVLKQLQVQALADWVDTGVDVESGETIRIVGDGSVTFPGSKEPVASNPGGVARTLRDVIKTYLVNDAGLGALVGRIGQGPGARPFLIGPEWKGRAPVKGRLYLAVNHSGAERGEGAYNVKVERLAAAAAAPDPSTFKLPAFPQDLLDKIPTRVQDTEGNKGDRVNFVIVGTRSRVREAFESAGWVLVDKDVATTVVQGILNTIQKRSYVTMPMSELYLFDRPQDFGYAQGDPVTVVAARHHFRLWQAPFDLEGNTIWAGAGTHDIGFDTDQRNGNITHKIDPDVDLEREHIAETLKGTGLVVRTEYLTPKAPIKTAKTAHGEEFHSDGRTLIIYLQPEAKTEGLLSPQ